MRKSFFALTILLALFLIIIPVLAADILIDGDLSDWIGLPSIIDDGGVDDWGSPQDADITEYSVHGHPDGVYVLMGWDDTSFNASGSRTGVTVLGADGNYYRVFSVMVNDPAVATVSGFSIANCGTDPECKNPPLTCEGGCPGVQVSSNTNWIDPWAGVAGHSSSNCADATPDCTALDAAAELFVPWQYIGGVPPDGQFIYMTYGSYPSGPGQAPKDYSGGGMCCRNVGGTINCYKCTPTAVDLVDVQASSMAYPSVWVLLLAAGLVAILSGFYLRKRTGSAD